MTVDDSKPQRPDSGYYDDEISLVDLWLVLERRKWVIAVVLCLCVGLGAAYALIKEPVYRYTTIIELARLGDDETVESTAAARNRISRVIIPMIRDEMMREEMGQAPEASESRAPGAGVEIPDRDGRLLELISEYPQARKEDVRLLHERVIDSIKAEHDGFVAAEKEYLELERERLRAEIRRMEAEKKRVAERIEDARSRLALGRALQQGQAPGEATDEARAMTLLIIHSQIEDAHRQLSELEEELHKRIPAREERLSINQVEIKNQLDRIAFTKVHATALASEAPVGTGKRLIIALSMVLGAMLGVFAAFFAEFFATARAAAAKRQDQDV